MKNEMLEAARLTRAGRLAEATALIRRTLGIGSAPAPAKRRTHFVDVNPPSIEVAPNTSSANKPEPPTREQEPPPKPEAETKTADKPPPQSRAGVPPASPAPLPTGLSMPIPDLLSQFPSQRGPARRRQLPAEAIHPPAGQWLTGEFTCKAGRRAYKLYLPSAYQAQGQPLPLVVMLHGCTQDADDFAAGTRMNFLAETEQMLVVYPEQTIAANNSGCWNWFQPAHQLREQGEPALIAGITRRVMAERHVDANRIYIGGLSAGGAMAAILAAAYPDLYAAVGVHSGLAPGSAHDLPSALQAMQRGGQSVRSSSPSRAIPLILFQGDQDSTVHPRNAEELIRQWTSAPNQDQPPATLREGQVPGGRTYSCAIYQDQNGRTCVERWTVHGASHAWSGGSRNGSFTDPIGPDASRELVRFFREHPRTSSGTDRD